MALGLLAVVLSSSGAGGLRAEDPSAGGEFSAEELAFFEAKIRPVLVSHCLECHSSELEVPDGGLALDLASGWEVGGDSGPAVTPGDSAGSLLVEAIRYESLEMPPEGKLPDSVIADFERWVEMGAPDPREGAPVAIAAQSEIDWNAARQFWAFRPPRPTSPPAVRDSIWPRSEIDAYVLAKLEAAGLRPAPDADPLVRLRRLAYDLTGLPPTPERMEAFGDDPSEERWREIVDELLHRPEYAEHWGRHWLDVARYADSNGSDFNATFHDAWRYRDYVIRSFANDKPFDQFITEQIAGDLLAASDPEVAAENLVATGFLMLGTKMLSERDKAKLEMDVVDDMIDSVGRAFLGLTLGCARCHDHKFDPIPTEDYYALAGIFRSTQVLDGESQKYVSTWHKRPLPVDPEHAAAVAEYEQQKQQWTADLNAAKKELNAAKAAVEGAKQKLVAATAALEKLEATRPPPLPMAMAVRDAATIGDTFVCVRGEANNRGPEVARGFLRICSSGPPAEIPSDQSGRVQLAEWLSSPQNPLTARVIVNRVWMHLFGEGLVRTVDNFGVQGERPTHPELLDRLTLDFIRDGWSVRRLVRRLVLTRAYAQSSRLDETAFAIDPENRLLWRASRRRLPAEAMRDTLLRASGQLDRTPSVAPMAGFGTLVTQNVATPEEVALQETPRRTVYLPVIRGKLSPFLTSFDFADPDLIVGRRSSTNVPTQGLVLLNNPEVRQWCEQIADRLRTTESEPHERLRRMYQWLLQREPTVQERQWLLEFAAGQADETEAWVKLVQTLVASTEFRFLD